uniref:50S ribosomal protein L35 n=1 Tax=Bangiopsis subsimplex TaxID=139980 RepID=A0A1C9CCZ8_9RHOD|nr:ribosomal protein L35 [Bangiopsis subsimplex]AOM66237.1 ribosomal protein L35 [Bangiopsis subsimplex]ARO90401.1 50S ribosomal protein L35 [Bangiopsis subsimplex]
MPKIKTSRAIAKRFKMTKTTKLLRKKSGKSHLLEKKNRNRKRHLSKSALVNVNDIDRIMLRLPYL